MTLEGLEALGVTVKPLEWKPYFDTAYEGNNKKRRFVSRAIDDVLGGALCIMEKHGKFSTEWDSTTYDSENDVRSIVEQERAVTIASALTAKTN